MKGTVHVTPKHNEEAKRLLRLMGVPVVEAPTEAEAQCAELVKKGLIAAFLFGLLHYNLFWLVVRQGMGCWD